MANVYQASADDLEDLAVLFNEYRMFYKQESDLEGTRVFLSERLALKESILFIARDESGQAMGFTQLYPSFSSVSMQRMFILNDLYVKPVCRKQGAAAKLLEAAREYASALQVKGLELSTAKDNLTAQRLYEQSGYEKDTEFEHYFLSLVQR
ncbi:GNAT family N-acetyltransferase [Paenibacillus chibensis]|uniref:GNAT family N-acetyltransferase n=1 Tax=Paenibacillus chibensis TaxID=59846 RepID=UPI000FD97BE0|nr:GNAT family N-acetyltransferase [Paenibacillus chibensis]MEC0370568.1 GNAT family N-acetyltransferase [Paenibacillus chibensis]